MRWEHVETAVSNVRHRLIQAAFRGGARVWRGPKPPAFLGAWRDHPERALVILPSHRTDTLPDQPWATRELPELEGIGVVPWPGFVEGALVELFDGLGAQRVPGVVVTRAREVGPGRAFLEFCAAFDLRGGRRATRRELCRAANRMGWLDQERDGAAYLDPTGLRWALLLPFGWPLRRRWRHLKRAQLVRHLDQQLVSVEARVVALETP